MNFRAWNCGAWDLKKACELDAAYVLAGPDTFETDCLRAASCKAKVLHKPLGEPRIDFLETSLLNTCHTRLKIQSSRCRGRRRTRNSALSQCSNCFTLRESNREVKRAEFCDRLWWLARLTSVLFRSMSELALQHEWPGPAQGFRANWLAKSDQGAYDTSNTNETLTVPTAPVSSPLRREAAAICGSHRWQLTALLTNQLLSSCWYWCSASWI